MPLAAKFVNGTKNEKAGLRFAALANAEALASGNVLPVYCKPKETLAEHFNAAIAGILKCAVAKRKYALKCPVHCLV